MEALSECVLAHEGVLVDYIGDELMAMWGAPHEQPNHAELACRAGLAMLKRLPELSARWQQQLGEPFSVGIGINTGIAHVGDVGSIHKFKYSPLGSTVNLASRVQGATKFLKVPLLITGTTAAGLGREFVSRRLCTVRVVNISAPTTIYQLEPHDARNWDALKDGYESALSRFECGEFNEAAQILGNLLSQFPEDGPSLMLISRTVEAMVNEPVGFDAVWDLPGK